MGKSRSKGQRVGTRGENEFRVYADRHGLLANKLEQDFGTDFLCQVEGRPDQRGVATVRGNFVAVAVRASSSDDGRIRLERDDAEQILSLQTPSCLVLVHLAPSGAVTVRHRFVDHALMLELSDLLEGNSDTLSFLPGALRDEANFDGDLATACVPGFVERERLALARAALGRVLPVRRIQVARGPDGQYTLLALDDMLDQFELVNGDDDVRVQTAVFGVERRMESRLSEVRPRGELLKAAAGLPSPLIITSNQPIASTRLQVDGDDGHAELAVDVRRTKRRVGYVHRSGFSLTTSDSRQHNGEWIHETEVRTDPTAKIGLSRHADLARFLACATPGASLTLGDQFQLDVEHFGELRPLGYFARYLGRFPAQFIWPSATFVLQDALSPEVLNTMALLAALAETPDAVKLAFTMSNVSLSETTRQPGRFWLPICANLARSGVVVWLEAEGYLFRDGDHYVGLGVERVAQVTIAPRKRRLPLEDEYPVLVVHPAWRGIALGPQVGPARTDVSKLHVRIVQLPLADPDASLTVLRRHAQNAERWSQPAE